MKANEFARKGFLSTKYALGVTMAIEGEKTITSEFRQAKEVILQWFEDRGKAADMIMFTVLAPDEQHAEIQSFFRRVADEEVQIAPIFKRLKGELNLMNLAGKSKSEGGFELISSSRIEYAITRGCFRAAGPVLQRLAHGAG